MCARWVRKSTLGQPQLLHKMITGTFTMPSEECVSSVAGQIFCRGENSSQREGLPHLIHGYWSLGTGLEGPLSSQTLDSTPVLLSPASLLRPSHPCASSPPLASPVLLCLPRELFFVYSKVLPSAFLAGFFLVTVGTTKNKRQKLGQGI